MAEKTSYFSTASAMANTVLKSCLSSLGWRLGYTNWNITSSTLESSVRRTSSPWVSNSADGKPPVVASRYLRCNLKVTLSDDKKVTSASLNLTRSIKFKLIRFILLCICTPYTCNAHGFGRLWRRGSLVASDQVPELHP